MNQYIIPLLYNSYLQCLYHPRNKPIRLLKNKTYVISKFTVVQKVKTEVTTKCLAGERSQIKRSMQTFKLSLQ